MMKTDITVFLGSFLRCAVTRVVLGGGWWQILLHGTRGILDPDVTQVIHAPLRAHFQTMRKVV